MLFLYQSNRLETLANILTTLQRNAPLQGALAPEEIIVQSQGMRRFLGMHLAQHTGIAANLNFNLPAGWAWRLMREFIPNTPALSPFAPEVMRWRLLKLFESDAFQTDAFHNSRQTLQGYLNSSEQASYQLAGQLADIFDQYLVYRPNWITSWKNGQLLNLGADEIWQAELWRFMDDDRQNAPHRVAQWQQLLDSLDAERLPERYFVFGIATLAPMYLQLLQVVAQHTDVHIFALNPSSEYWGNIIEPAQILHSRDDIDLSQSGHPLLASLGKQGRDFFDALAEANIHHNGQYFDTRLPDTLLNTLQYDIQTLNPSCAPQYLHDGSIRISSAHSPLRELQILKDNLLQILAENPDWQPHDIAVLTPNIEPYSPFIEAVFGQNPHSQPLPYSLSDIRLSRRQPLLHALEQLLTLLESRFEIEHLLPLLENTLVLNRFQLSRETLPLLHDTIHTLNIHWGLNQTMRSEHGADNPLFTWQQGIDRLILGWMLPQTEYTLWQNISPWHSDINQIEVFSRFSAFIHTLADTWQQWQQPADINSWTERIRQAIQQLFSLADTDQAALQQLEQALAQWQQQAETAAFSGSLNVNIAIRHLSQFLNSTTQAAFLRGGITFCSMVPMRSLPFKMVCLLGLNDGDFPRNTKAAALDLIARHPQKGDRARRDDDRYLFLEAILSARHILYLSYLGRDVDTNEPLAPSALLSELINTLADMTEQKGDMTQQKSANLLQEWVVQHPLQAFSTEYFQADAAHRFSTRTDYADALNQTLPARQPFLSTHSFNSDERDPHLVSVTLADFLQFWRNPIRHWLRKQLDWKQPYAAAAWDNAEPFQPIHTQTLYQQYLHARRQNQSFESVATTLQARSLVPEGLLGELWQQKFQINVKQLDSQLCQSPKQPNLPFELKLGDYSFSGSLSQLYQHGQIFFSPQSPNNPELLTLWLQHLIYCAVSPSSLPLESHLLVPGTPESWPAIEASSAQAQLKMWLHYYHLGQTQPLPFFAKTSIAAAQAWLKTDRNNDDDAAGIKAALTEAKNSYRGNPHNQQKGVCDYPEVVQVFGADELEPIDNPLFLELVSKLLLPLLRKLEPSRSRNTA